MSTSEPRPAPEPGPERRAHRPRVTGQGLCPRCRWVRRIESARGSVFLLCERSQADASFPRYPPQPVVACAGFES